MSCETNYAKMEQQIPEELKKPESTGHGSLDLLLRVRAAKFWHESLTTLSERQLQSYCKYVIDFQYPDLHENNADLYRILTFSEGAETDLNNIYNYQWWLAYVTGPNSCTRDIAYFCQLLNIDVNEDWSDELEQALITYQQEHPLIEYVTGYGCAETLKRLRLELEGVSTA